MERSIRIGKDFNVRWSIRRVVDGERQPYELAGKELVLQYRTPYGLKEATEWKVVGNTIVWTFRGKEQKALGSYELILTENGGKDGMVTVDTCRAFKLVAHSCEETEGSGSDIVIEDVVLESEVTFAALRGPQGERGPEGPQGPQGERGPQGEQGPAGPSYNDTDIKNKLTELSEEKEDKSNLSLYQDIKVLPCIEQKGGFISGGIFYDNATYKVDIYPFAKGDSIEVKIIAADRSIPSMEMAAFFLGENIPSNNGKSIYSLGAIESGKTYVATYDAEENGYICVASMVGVAALTQSVSLKAKRGYIDFATKIYGLEEDVVALQETAAENKTTKLLVDISAHSQLTLSAYIYSQGTTIDKQPENTGRKIICFPISKGNHYLVKGVLPNASIYTFIAFKEGVTEPKVADTVDIIQPYGDGAIINVERELSFDKDGWLLIGFNGQSIQHRAEGYDWRVYQYQAIDDSPMIRLPKKIRAVMGDTLQVFKRAYIMATDPYAFDVAFISKYGISYPRYYMLNPTIEGSHEIKVQLRNIRGQIYDMQTAELKVVKKPSSPSSLKRIAVFGDSLTQAGTWVAEAARRLLSSDAPTDIAPGGSALSNIRFIGAMGSDNARYYGVGGWSWESYATEGSPAFRFHVTGVGTIVKGDKYTNNGFTYEVVENNTTNGEGNILCFTSSANNIPSTSGNLIKSQGSGDASIAYSSMKLEQSNPLWHNGAISFSNYLDNIGEDGVDEVIFFLGWNSLAVEKKNFSVQKTHISNLLNKLHQEFPSAKARLMGLQLPSLNGGLGANYGATEGYSDTYGIIRALYNYNAFLESLEDEFDFVEYVDVACQFDSENNMPSSESNVNIRNSKKEIRGTNGVHPSNEGYMQIADVVYRLIVHDFC